MSATATQSCSSPFRGEAVPCAYRPLSNATVAFLRSAFARGPGRFTLRPAIPGLRNIVIGVAVVFVALFLLSFAVRITRIEAGHVGVEINLAGRQRGAWEIPVRTGWVIYSPLTTQIIEFPTYVQTMKWTKDVNEGHQANEEMGFNSKEGMEILVDVSLPYAIEPA